MFFRVNTDSAASREIIRDAPRLQIGNRRKSGKGMTYRNKKPAQPRSGARAGLIRAANAALYLDHPRRDRFPERSVMLDENHRRRKTPDQLFNLHS